MCVCVCKIERVLVCNQKHLLQVSVLSLLVVCMWHTCVRLLSVLIVVGVSMLSILIACAQSVHMLLMLVVCCGCWYAVSADSMCVACVSVDCVVCQCAISDDCVACVSVPLVLIVLQVSVCHQC